MMVEQGPCRIVVNQRMIVYNNLVQAVERCFEKGSCVVVVVLGFDIACLKYQADRNSSFHQW